MESNAQNEALWRLFDERRELFEEAKTRYFRWFIGNIVVLFALAIIIFAGIMTGIALAAASWIEFFVALPLVYSAFFFQSQHAKARDYLEEYSFKTVVAKSLPDYRRFIKEGADAAKAEDRKKCLDFVVATAKGIFTPPRENISKHPLKEEGTIPVGTAEKIGDIFKKFVP